MKKSDPPVIVEQTFAVDRDTLWKAITEAAQMRRWFFDNIPAFEPAVGFKTQFNVSTGEREFPHRWEIIEVIPAQKITYRWQYEGYAGDSTVAFELFGAGDAVGLRVTATVLEDFSYDIPEFKRESCEGGWNYFIKQSLVNYLAS
ncbi:MAG: SRPBCC domain-containing protein [Acidobacteriota bacterium]|nr:SRPBCC domain-containing protein [Acidobacteriota bacterium]